MEGICESVIALLRVYMSGMLMLMLMMKLRVEASSIPGFEICRETNQSQFVAALKLANHDIDS